MLTSRTWIISSGLVGALSLMLRSVLNFSFTGASIFLPTSNPLFIINGIIFAVAASASVFGHGSDSTTTKHQDKQHNDDDDDTYHYDEHDHVRSSDNSSSSSFDQYNNKVHEEEKVPVRSESRGTYGVSSPEVRFPSTAPEKAFGLRRPPTAPVKTFPQDDISTDEGETMEEMWKRVKSQKQPKKPNSLQNHVISRSQDSKMSTSSSTSSLPSPSRARKHPPSWTPSSSRTRKPPPSGMKLMERIPSWVKLKKELSMGREELNSRAEAFIAKFKDEMKLQRSESLRRYKLFRRSSDEK